jgi:hypothetical protein
MVFETTHDFSFFKLLQHKPVLQPLLKSIYFEEKGKTTNRTTTALPSICFQKQRKIIALIENSFRTSE